MTSSINFSHSARRKLLITGVPPQVIINRASAAFDLSIWRQTRPIGAQLALQAEDHDAVIVMPGDKLDAATIASLPQCVQVLGTYSVGCEREEATWTPIDAPSKFEQCIAQHRYVEEGAYHVTQPKRVRQSLCDPVA